MAAMSMDIFLPSLPTLKEAFQTEESVLQLSISLFMWAFAITQLMAGILSDRYGRKPIFIIGCSLYILASFGCALAASFSQLLIFRFLQGFAACVGPVTALSITRDLLPEKERAKALSFIASAMALAPILAPLLGSFFETFFDWRASFVFLAFFAAILLLSLRQLPETNLHQTAIHWKKMFGSYYRIASNPIWQIYGSIAACSFCSTFLWISASSIYLIDRLHFSQFQFALFFGVSAASFMLSSFFNSILVSRLPINTLIWIGSISTSLGGLLMFSFSWLELSVWRLWTPAILLSFGIGFILPNTNAAALTPFQKDAGKAAALTNFFRLSLAGGSVWLMSRFYDSHARSLSLAIFIFGILQVSLSLLNSKRISRVSKMEC